MLFALDIMSRIWYTITYLKYDINFIQGFTMKNKEGIIVVNPLTTIEHKIASKHRRHTEAEFLALKLDIEQNGQLLPVILYRGKLVDGRHRMKAIRELGIKEMAAIELNNNLSLAEVEQKVISSENRRTDTAAQKGIRAFIWAEENEATQTDAGIKFAVSRQRISEAKKLNDIIGRVELRKMYEQGYMFLNDRRHTQMITLLKALDTSKNDNPNIEPVNEKVKYMFEDLQTMMNGGDIVGIAQIENYAKNLRQRKD